ncbi:MAG: thioredoxin family protein [Bacteroidia bacterium]|nr:thioredoxin family protein [Bacteroidia bacterium]MBT8277467.1 thioredoxin family protein [Bacteroidia bacterium]NNK61086.1 thioredoxin family protein [Flavobacteriaceae bacterium]RZW57309.1 MAG: thioredoxin family protein [Flavobacteriaceae bacterium]
MKTLLETSLNNSISYPEYKLLIDKMVQSRSTTGSEKTEALIEYTKLNQRRMKRWDKTIRLSEDHEKLIKEFDEKIIWLVISESWCGDAAHVIPVINKVAEVNPNIELRIVLRDDNPDLMDAFLTNGSRSIPKLIMIDAKSTEFLGLYGPRPSQATKMVTEFKEEHGLLTPEFKEDLQRWYNKDKGQTIIKDLLELLRLSSKIKSDCA